MPALMNKLLIFRPPGLMRSAPDVIHRKTITGLQAAGIPCSVHDLWPQWCVRRIWGSSLPGRQRIFEYGPALLSLGWQRRKISAAGVVWINGVASPLNRNCWFERAVLKAGKPYIFHLQDDWFSVPFQRPQAEARVRLASLVVVPTLPLKDRILALFPDAKVLVLEEPIDIDRVRPVAASADSDLPFFVWSGSAESLDDLKKFTGIFGRIHAKFPFKIRVICGQTKPAIEMSFPWEWFPYDATAESVVLAGAAAGLAPLEDGAYARCKGGYKVKTYLAAGIPIVASPVGHHARVIQSGINGFLADTETEWEQALLALLADRDLGRRLGAAARESAVTKYSHEVLMPIWADQLRAALPQIAGL